jgi:hypothetical protein
VGRLGRLNHQRLDRPLATAHPSVSCRWCVSRCGCKVLNVDFVQDIRQYVFESAENKYESAFYLRFKFER